METEELTPEAIDLTRVDMSTREYREDLALASLAGFIVGITAMAGIFFFLGRLLA